MPNNALHADAMVAGAAMVPSGCALGAGERGRWADGRRTRVTAR